MNIIRYNSEYQSEWNEFLKISKNNTFLFNRGFMDYHSDRFKDHSALVYDKKDNLIACFPANEKDKSTIVSHQGLTYGGLIVEDDIKLPVFINVFSKLLKFYHQNGFYKLILKSFPRIYNNLPSDEIEYCTFLLEAELIRRDTAIVVDLENRIKYSGNYRREAKKAKESGYQIEESNNLKTFWNELLIPNLQERFGVNPVHTTDEILLLKKRFPGNIKLYVAKSNEDKVVAGTIFFITEQVAHCQYIASNNEARDSGALNLLFIELLDNEFKDQKYFDFGIVNEGDGKVLNKGMLAWKERMGGRTVSHDFYKINTNNYKNLSKVIE